MPPWIVVVIFCVLFHAIHSAHLPVIYWNSSNPMINHCAEADDTVELRCPHHDSNHKSRETSLIYRVSVDDYDTCRLGPGAKLVGRCSNPEVETNIKFTLRAVQPNPFALTYPAGKTYYFISTSTGHPDGLGHKLGGLCITHALKMRLDVKKRGDPCPTSPPPSPLPPMLRRKQHHRHKHVVLASTREVPLEETSSAATKWQREDDGGDLRRLNDSPWTDFWQKIEKPLETEKDEVKREDPFRAERVAIDAKATEYALENSYSFPVQKDVGQVLFEIHEIGEDPDYLPYRSSSSEQSSSMTISLLLLLALIA